MKINKLLITLTLGLTISTASLANAINSSWDVRNLKAHSISSVVKNAKSKQYSRIVVTKSDSEKRIPIAQKIYSKIILNLFKP